MSETYKIAQGLLAEDVPFVQQQIIQYLKDITESKQVLIGYRSYENMLGVPREVLKIVDQFAFSGMDVLQTGASTLPEVSLLSRLMGAAVCFIDDDKIYYLDSSGCYVDGELPVLRIERSKRGKLSRLNPRNEYVRHLRREIDPGGLQDTAIAIGGMFDNDLLSLISQVLPVRGLWKVRSENEAELQALSGSVQRMQAQVGIRLDTTGAKAEFVDDRGEKIPLYAAAALLARYLKDVGNLKAVAKSWEISRLFNRLAEKAGLQIKKNADFFAGEEIIYKPHLGVGDGLWLGLMLVEISAVAKRPLSDLLAEMDRLVGKAEVKMFAAEKAELESYLRKIMGSRYILEKEGELQSDGVVIAWERAKNNLYRVLLDGEPSKLQVVQNALFQDTFQ